MGFVLHIDTGFIFNGGGGGVKSRNDSLVVDVLRVSAYLSLSFLSLYCARGTAHARLTSFEASASVPLSRFPAVLNINICLKELAALFPFFLKSINCRILEAHCQHSIVFTDEHDVSALLYFFF